MTNDGGGTRTILLVDDSARIRPLVKQILSGLNWRILEADGAQQAVDLAAEHGGEIDLLLTDITMPGKSGVELATELRALYPQLKVLYMSGYALPSTGKDLHFIEKPFRPDALLRKVHEILATSESASA